MENLILNWKTPCLNGREAMIKLLIILLLGLSCESPEKKDKREKIPLLDESQRGLLADKFNLYKELSKETLDEKLWIKDTRCDGLLFQSLFSMATGIGDPYLAEDSDNKGKYYRYHEHDCYFRHISNIPNGSTSETSRDMYLGLLLYVMHKGDKGKVKDIIKFGEANKWIMGEADNLGAVEFRPDTLGIIYQIQFHFGLGDSKARLIPLAYDKCKDFSCHLRALAIWLMHDAGRYGERDRKALKDLTKIDERNAFFFALYAYMENDRVSAQKAYKYLMESPLFPDDRLPTNKEKCGFYLWEREPTSSAWKPCPDRKPKQVWSGIDFLIAAYILLEG